SSNAIAVAPFVLALRICSRRLALRQREEPDVTAVQLRGDRAAPAAARGVRARGDLARSCRGALPALPGLRRKAQRDPRQARRGRPRLGEPGVLGAPGIE